jgi:hypothetical protein
MKVVPLLLANLLASFSVNLDLDNEAKVLADLLSSNPLTALPKMEFLDL